MDCLRLSVEVKESPDRMDQRASQEPLLFLCVRVPPRHRVKLIFTPAHSTLPQSFHFK